MALVIITMPNKLIFFRLKKKTETFNRRVKKSGLHRAGNFNLRYKLFHQMIKYVHMDFVGFYIYLYLQEKPITTTQKKIITIIVCYSLHRANLYILHITHTVLIILIYLFNNK